MHDCTTHLTLILAVGAVYILRVNLQNYLETSPLQQASNVPKLPGIDYVAKELGTSHDVKSFAIGSFLEHIVVERGNDDLC